MKRKPTARLIRLQASGWHAWHALPAGSFVSSAPLDPATFGSPSPDILAVPARHVVAVPVWVESEDPAVVKTSLELELEMRGFPPRQAVVPASFASAGRTLVTCAVFPQELPEPWANRFFGRYEASPFLRGLPEDAVALWLEGEDVVAVFTRGDQPVHWATIDRTESRATIGRWLERLELPLLAAGILERPPHRIVVDANLPGDEPFLTGVPVEQAELPASLKNARFIWKPESARIAEQQTAARRKIRRAILALAALYLVGALGAGVHLGWLAWKAASLRKQIAALETATAEFQPVMREWRTVGPGAEPGFFPLEILHLLALNLPPRGVRLTTFDFGGNKIFVEGEATSAGLAAEFYSALSRDEALREIRWKMPSPSLQPNNAARFQLSGVLP